MADIINNDSQTDYHQLNTGQTVLPVKFTITAANVSHGAGHAISDEVEVIGGATRFNGYSARIVSIRLNDTVTTGSASAKSCVLYLASRQAIPTTDISAGGAITLTQLDAPYIVAAIPFDTGEWIKTSRMATIHKPVSIDFINEDLTVGNTLYAFLVHTGSTHTYALNETFDITIFIQQN